MNYNIKIYVEILLETIAISSVTALQTVMKHLSAFLILTGQSKALLKCSYIQT